MRIIPSLCFLDNRVFKTNKFNKTEYLGDLLNIVRLYNNLFCDELCLINLSSNINFELIQRVSEEASMPLSYSGSINSQHQVERLVSLGIEKVVINSLFHKNLNVYKDILKIFGRSTISLGIDYKIVEGGKYIFYSSGVIPANKTVIQVAEFLAENDIVPGEVILSCIDKDGSFSGLDYEILSSISISLSCPIVLNCGLSSYTEINDAKTNQSINGIMGSGLFVYVSNAKGILINYEPNEHLHHLKKSLEFIYE